MKEIETSHGAVQDVKKNKKPLVVALLVCGGLLSAALAISLPWFSLPPNPGNIIVIGSTVLPWLPFYAGLFFLVLSIVLFFSAYRIAVSKPKSERAKITSGIRWLYIMPVVVFCFLAICICVAEAGDKAFELSGTDTSEERTVVLLDYTFMGDRYAVIYELPPHSIIAHKTKTLYRYDPEWRW